MELTNTALPNIFLFGIPSKPESRTKWFLKEFYNQPPQIKGNSFRKHEDFRTFLKGGESVRKNFSKLKMISPVLKYQLRVGKGG